MKYKGVGYFFPYARFHNRFLQTFSAKGEKIRSMVQYDIAYHPLGNSNVFTVQLFSPKPYRKLKQPLTFFPLEVSLKEETLSVGCHFPSSL